MLLSFFKNLKKKEKGADIVEDIKISKEKNDCFDLIIYVWYNKNNIPRRKSFSAKFLLAFA